MKHFIFAALGFFIAITPAHAGGFTQDLFEAWLDLRMGGGKGAVYWYSEGMVKQFPGGADIAKMVGFDVSHVMQDEADPTKATHLSRKIFIFLDPETGEMMDRPPIEYEYQLKTYDLEGDEIVYTVESRAGDRISHVPPVRNYSVKQIDDVLWFNYSVFIDRGTGKFENSDFYLIPGEGLSEQERYQHSWVSYGVGPMMSQAVAWRYSSFDDLPDVIQSYVRDNAPLWMAPPQDLAEVDRLRNEVQTAQAQ